MDKAPVYGTGDSEFDPPCEYYISAQNTLRRSQPTLLQPPCGGSGVSFFCASNHLAGPFSHPRFVRVLSFSGIGSSTSCAVTFAFSSTGRSWELHGLCSQGGGGDKSHRNTPPLEPQIDLD
eukprot:7958586-Pyramimonas_sp.AAC.3